MNSVSTSPIRTREAIELFLQTMDVIHSKRLRGEFPSELWEKINQLDEQFTTRIQGRARGYGGT